MVFAADFVQLCLKQTGDRYIFGQETSISDPDPDAFDCSELIQWAGGRLGIAPTVPDGSWLQARHCSNHHTLCPVDEGIDTQGALLFRFSGDPFSGGRPESAHVAVSLGNGNTIEARGRRWGVGSFATAGRTWTHAGRIPGVTYEAPPESPTPISDQDLPETAVIPQWPGRYLTQPPIMPGTDVGAWQQRMADQNWDVKVDSKYGPESEGVCRTLQTREGLRVDGIVGPDTWRAAWTSPPRE